LILLFNNKSKKSKKNDNDGSQNKEVEKISYCATSSAAFNNQDGMEASTLKEKVHQRISK
jgi:hypothetical protein